MKRCIKKIMSVVIGLSILSSSSILAKKEIKHENIAYNKSKRNHNNLKPCVKVGSAIVLPTLILAYLNKNKLFNMFSKKNFKISEIYSDKINRENQLRGQSNTYSKPGNFINLYNRAGSNSSSPKLMLCHELNKEKIKFFELPPIKTVFESFGLTNVPEKPDLNWYTKYTHTYITINDETKKLFIEWFPTARGSILGNLISEFIFGREYVYSRFEELLFNGLGKDPNCLEFYSRLLYWINEELKRNGFQNGMQLLQDLNLTHADLVFSTPIIPKTYNKKQCNCANLWFMFARAFCQYDEEQCLNQLRSNISSLERVLVCYYNSARPVDESTLQTRTFSEVLFPTAHTDLTNHCLGRYVEGRNELHLMAEYASSFDFQTADLLNVDSQVGRGNQRFCNTYQPKQIAEILREFLTSKYILDTIIDNSEKFDYNFRLAIVNWWLNDYAFNRFDYDLLNQLYDNELDSEINSLINMLLTYNEKDIVKARKILQNLKAHKTVSLGDLNEVAEIIACEYSELLEDLHIVTCLFKDIRKYEIPDLDTMKRQFAFAYMFKLKEEKYIDFTSQA